MNHNRNILPAVKGFAVAPLAAALPIPAVLDGSFNHYLEWQPWGVVLPIVYGCALVLGVPAYFLLRNRIAYTPLRLGLFGGLAAALPMLLVLPWYWGAGVFFVLVTFCGALGGVVFWWFTQHLHAK